MDLIDRLISAAGGVADAADRVAGLFGRAGSRRWPELGPVLVAGGSALLAVLFLFVGVEATDTTAPRAVGAGVGEDPSFGDHAHVTVSGQVASEYGGHFFDDNGNGTQDPGELDADYVYVVADPTTHAALTVVSARPPSDIYRTSRVGQVKEDASYITEDLPYISDDIRDLGITLDRDRYIDTRSVSGDPATIHLADRLPDPGTPVTFDDGIVATWTWICATGDHCDEAHAGSFDLLVYDDVSKRGVIVVTDHSPEWTPVTFSGMLRREEHAVSEALDPDVFDLATMGVTVSSRYLLDDGTTPVSPMIAWVFAAVFGVLAGLIFVGSAADYLIYRRASPSLPAPARTLAVGDAIRVHVTGWLRTPSGLTRVREVPADLVRFATVAEPGGVVEPEGPAEPDEPVGADEPDRAAESDGAAEEPASTLIVQRRGRPEGVALGLGEVSRLSVGNVFPLRGRRPAVRAVTGTGPLLLSFDTASDRDRAAAEVLDETGIARHDDVAGPPAAPTGSIAPSEEP